MHLKMFPTLSLSVGKGSISLIWLTLFILSNLPNHGNCEETPEVADEHCKNVKCAVPPPKYICGKCKKPHPRAEKYLGSVTDCCPHWCCTDKNRRKILFVGLASKKMQDWDSKLIQQSKEEFECWNVTCPISTPVTISCKVDPKPSESFQLLNPDHAHCCPTLECRTVADNSTVKSFRLIEGHMPADPPSIQEEKGVAGNGTLCPKIQCMEKPTPPPGGSCEEVVIPIESALSPQEMEIVNEFHECCPKMWMCSDKEESPQLIYGLNGPSFKYYSTVLYIDAIEKGLGHCENVTCRPPTMDHCTIIRHPSPEILKFAKDKIDCCPVYNCSGADGWTAIGFSTIEGVLPEPEPGNVTSDTDCEHVTCGSRPTGIEASCTPTERKTSVSRSLGRIRGCCNSWECLYSNSTIYNYYQITGHGYSFREIQTTQLDSSDYLVLLVDKKDQIYTKRLTLPPTTEPTNSSTLGIGQENATTGFGNTTEGPWIDNATIVNGDKPESKKVERIVRYYVGGNGTVERKLIEERTFSNVTCIRFSQGKTEEKPVSATEKVPAMKNGTSKPIIIERTIVVLKNGTEVAGTWRNVTSTTPRAPPKVTPRKGRNFPPKKVTPKSKVPPKVPPRPKVAPKPKVIPKPKIVPKPKVTPKAKVTPPKKVTPKMKVTPRTTVVSTTRRSNATNATTTIAATNVTENYSYDDDTSVSVESASTEVTFPFGVATTSGNSTFPRINGTTEIPILGATQFGIKEVGEASNVSETNISDITGVSNESRVASGDPKNEPPSGTTPAYHPDTSPVSITKGPSRQDGRRLEDGEIGAMEDKMITKQGNPDNKPPSGGITPAYYPDTSPVSITKGPSRQDGRRMEGGEGNLESVANTTQSQVQTPIIQSTIRPIVDPSGVTPAYQSDTSPVSITKTPSKQDGRRFEGGETGFMEDKMTKRGDQENESPSGTTPAYYPDTSPVSITKGPSRQDGRRLEDGEINLESVATTAQSEARIATGSTAGPVVNPSGFTPAYYPDTSPVSITKGPSRQDGRRMEGGEMGSMEDKMTTERGDPNNKPPSGGITPAYHPDTSPVSITKGPSKQDGRRLEGGQTDFMESVATTQPATSPSGVAAVSEANDSIAPTISPKGNNNMIQGTTPTAIGSHAGVTKTNEVTPKPQVASPSGVGRGIKGTALSDIDTTTKSAKTSSKSHASNKVITPSFAKTTFAAKMGSESYTMIEVTTPHRDTSRNSESPSEAKISMTATTAATNPSHITPKPENLPARSTSTEKTVTKTSRGGTDREAPSGAPTPDQIHSTSPASNGKKRIKQFGRRFEDGHADDDNTAASYDSTTSRIITSSGSGSGKLLHQATTAHPRAEDLPSSGATPSPTKKGKVALSETTVSSDETEQDGDDSNVKYSNDKETSSSDNNTALYYQNLSNASKSKEKKRGSMFDGMISNRNSRKGSRNKGNNLFQMNQQSGLSELSQQSGTQQGQNWGNSFKAVLNQDKEDSSSTNNTLLFFQNLSNSSRSKENSWESMLGGKFSKGNRKGSENALLQNLQSGWAELPKQSGTHQEQTWEDPFQAARQHIQQMNNDQSDHQKIMTQHFQGMNQNLQLPNVNPFPFQFQQSIFNHNLLNQPPNDGHKPSGKRGNQKVSSTGSETGNAISSEYSEKMEKDSQGSGKSSRRAEGQMAPAKSGSSASRTQNSKSESHQQSSFQQSFGHMQNWEQQVKQMQQQFGAEVTKSPGNEGNDATRSKAIQFEENKSMKSSNPGETVGFSNSAGQGYTGQSSSSSSSSRTMYQHQKHESSSSSGSRSSSSSIHQGNQKSRKQNEDTEDHIDDTDDLQTEEEDNSEKRSKSQASGSDKATASNSAKIGHCEAKDYICPKLKFKGTCSQDNSSESKRFLPENENCCALTLCVDRNIHRTYYVKYIGRIPTEESEIQEEKGTSQDSIQCPNVKCQNDSTVPSYQSCSEAKEAQPRMGRMKPFLECCPMMKCLRNDESYSVELRITSKSFSYYEIAFYNIKDWNPVETRTIIYESKGSVEKENEEENHPPPGPPQSQVASPIGNGISSQNGGGGLSSGQLPGLNMGNLQQNPLLQLQFNPQQLIQDQLGQMQNMQQQLGLIQAHNSNQLAQQMSQLQYSTKSRSRGHGHNGFVNGDGMPQVNAHLARKPKNKRKPKTKVASGMLDANSLG